MMSWIRQGIIVDQKEMYENCKRRLAIYNATPIEQYEKRKELLVDLLGPGVHIYCANHPLDHMQRRTGQEIMSEVVIGDDVWIGGHTTINPGVHIGKRSVIGSGSVVTHNIPSDVVACGNPCRVIRSLR